MTWVAYLNLFVKYICVSMYDIMLMFYLLIVFLFYFLILNWLENKLHDFIFFIFFRVIIILNKFLFLNRYSILLPYIFII